MKSASRVVRGSGFYMLYSKADPHVSGRRPMTSIYRATYGYRNYNSVVYGERGVRQLHTYHVIQPAGYDNNVIIIL